MRIERHERYDDARVAAQELADRWRMNFSVERKAGWMGRVYFLVRRLPFTYELSDLGGEVVEPSLDALRKAVR